MSTVTADPTVFVVDDDRAVRESLRWLVESVGLEVETYDSARSFLDAYTVDRPGCLVLDVRMRGMSGIEMQEALAGRGITLPVIVITGFGDVATAVRAMKLGAVDFVEKPFNDQELLELIQRCIDRDAGSRREDTDRAAVLARMSTLTHREREVFDLVVDGKSNKETARILKVSPKTVEIHRARVMEKMQADTLAELVRMAVRRDGP